MCLEKEQREIKEQNYERINKLNERVNSMKKSHDTIS
jgi:hypothetical protein